MILQLFDNPLIFFSILIALVIGLSIHEFAHALIADKLGDPTAKYQGRLTIDPRQHLDPIGTFMLIVAGFGWGRPVPINSQYFQRPEIDELLVALAGPASNLIMAGGLGLLIQFNPIAIIDAILLPVIYINVLLAIFNLIPIPPLDGSKILRPFVSEETFRSLELLSLPVMILLLVIINGTGFGNLITDWTSTLTAFFAGA